MNRRRCVFLVMLVVLCLGLFTASAYGATVAPVRTLQADHTLPANGVVDSSTSQSVDRLLSSERALDKEVLGFYVGQEGRIPSAYPTVVAQKDKLTAVAPFWYRLDPDNPTDLQLDPNTPASEVDRLINFCKTNGVNNYALVHNLLYKEHNGREVVRTVLSDPNKRWALVMNIFKLLKAKGFNGVCLDIENVYAKDKGLYTQFLIELAAQLKPAGYEIIACVPAKVTDEIRGVWGDAFDYAKIGHYADRVVIMTYDEHGNFSDPGPVASVGFTDQVIRYALTRIPRSKILVGVAGYGYDWNTTAGMATYISYQMVMDTARQYGKAVSWDAAAQVPYFSYTDRQEASHRVYFENASSWAAKLDLVNRHGLRGIAIWRLGMEDPAGWNVIAAKFRPAALRIKVNGVVLSTDVPPYIDTNKRTMVPLRFVAAALGAEVTWKAATKEVLLVKGSQTLKLRVGSTKYETNGSIRTMDTLPVLRQGRVMVPLRFVGEALGAGVVWQSATNEVLITTPAR